MDQENEYENGKAKRSGTTSIIGNPVFHAPVHFQVNYHYDKPTNVPSIEKEQTSQDLLVFTAKKMEYSDHLGSKNIYQIKKNRKGRVLIINNEFKEREGERIGSSLDVMNMVQLWDQIGCAVEVEKNLTGSEIKERIEEFASSKRMNDVDFCVVFVMSHGKKEDFIVGENSTEASVTELVQVVKKSDSLRGKPKLLFFQMCRGEKGQKSDQVDVEGMDTSDSTWFLKLLKNLLPGGVEIGAESTQVDVREETQWDATAEEHLEGSEDMMIAFATQPDHVSFRSPKEGSWFITAIAKVFSEHAKDMHLKELIVKVREEVHTKTSNCPNKPEYDDCIATVEAKDTFQGKKLYLFPGYPQKSNP